MAALAHLAVLIFPGLRVLFPGGEPGLEAADGTEPDDHDDARGAVARRELALHRVWRLSGTAAHPAPDGRGKVGGLPQWTRRIATFGLWLVGLAIFRASGFEMA